MKQVTRDEIRETRYEEQNLTSRNLFALPINLFAPPHQSLYTFWLTLHTKYRLQELNAPMRPLPSLKNGEEETTRLQLCLSRSRIPRVWTQHGLWTLSRPRRPRTEREISSIASTEWRAYWVRSTWTVSRWTLFFFSFFISKIIFYFKNIHNQHSNHPIYIYHSIHERERERESFQNVKT